MPVMAVKKVPCSFSITKKLLDELDEYAAIADDNRSEIVERFIQEGLKRAKKKAGA
jgi:metal-responsive CopG/Arc/MetJ family transcriptional regulator